jgi:hypothetical protein
MSEMYKALHFDKVKVKGYFCWSFYDVRQTPRTQRSLSGLTAPVLVGLTCTPHVD